MNPQTPRPGIEESSELGGLPASTLGVVSEEAQHRHHPDQPKTDDQAARRAPPYQQRDAEQKDHYQNVHAGMLCPNRCRCGSDRASGGRGKTGTRRSDYRKGPWRRRQPPSSVTKTTMSGDPGGWVNTGLGPVGWSAGIHQLISDQRRSPRSGVLVSDSTNVRSAGRHPGNVFLRCRDGDRINLIDRLV